MFTLVKRFFGMFDGDPCPKCNSTNTAYCNWHKDWTCISCGHEWE